MSDSEQAPLFHLIAPADWADAQAAGSYRARSLDTEGFIHCSFADQVGGTLSRHYPGVSGLLLVEFDPARITAPILVEDSSGSGTAFPHVYGPIPVAAAVGTYSAERWISDRGGRDGAASPDH